MIDEKRIKEAENNVKIYLKDELIKKINNSDSNILGTLKKNCDESIKTADFLYENNMSWLWVIVCSYYSMFYCANLALYKSGYKVGDKIVHKVTSDSLIVYIRKKLKEKLIEDFETAREEAIELAGIKTDELIENFEFEMSKRGRFQYNMTDEVKKGKAETSLKRAKSFIFEMEKLFG
jgi:uncharacterized protein (UPF0332 family)